MRLPRGNWGIRLAYGNPRGRNDKLNPKWYRTHIVRVSLPYPMRLAWQTYITVKDVSMHQEIARFLYAALQDIYDHERIEIKHRVGFSTYDTPTYDRLTLERLQAAGLDLLGGAFTYRKKRGSRKLSTHAWGIAFDLNPAANRWGSRGNMPDWVVEIFKKWGFTWGGYWRKSDPMHFQAARNY